MKTKLLKKSKKVIFLAIVTSTISWGTCVEIPCMPTVASQTLLLVANIEKAFLSVQKERVLLQKNYYKYAKELERSNELEEKLIRTKTMIFLTLKEIKSVKEQILKERISKNENKK
jgi:hypothetical protein